MNSDPIEVLRRMRIAWPLATDEGPALSTPQVRPYGCDACGDAGYTVRPSGPHTCWKCKPAPMVDGAADLQMPGDVWRNSDGTPTNIPHPAPQADVARLVEAATTLRQRQRAYLEQPKGDRDESKGRLVGDAARELDAALAPFTTAQEQNNEQ